MLTDLLDADDVEFIVGLIDDDDTGTTLMIGGRMESAPRLGSSLARPVLIGLVKEVAESGSRKEFK